MVDEYYSHCKNKWQDIDINDASQIGGIVFASYQRKAGKKFRLGFM
jgi:hypothetical protein